MTQWPEWDVVEVTTADPPSTTAFRALRDTIRPHPAGGWQFTCSHRHSPDRMDTVITPPSSVIETRPVETWEDWALRTARGVPG